MQQLTWRERRRKEEMEELILFDRERLGGNEGVERGGNFEGSAFKGDAICLRDVGLECECECVCV